MSTRSHKSLSRRLKLFGIVLLGVTAAAVAHHGNPQAPVSSPWYGYLPPGSPKPATPTLPGQ